MSIVLQSTGGGSVTINEPSTASNFTQTLPASTGTVITTGSPQSGSVLQAIEFALSTQYALSPTSTPTSIGLSATITPKFTTSKILILTNVWLNAAAAAGGSGYVIYRGATAIWDYQETTGSGGSFNTYFPTSVYIFQNLQTIDSPVTTSATTYEVKVTPYNSTITYNSNSTYGSSRSSIILMEIAA
jgi:hypothetical protein